MMNQYLLSTYGGESEAPTAPRTLEDMQSFMEGIATLDCGIHLEVLNRMERACRAAFVPNAGELSRGHIPRTPSSLHTQYFYV
jgi:hypothetical protein